jgi:hypothetical protein
VGILSAIAMALAPKKEPVPPRLMSEEEAIEERIRSCIGGISEAGLGECLGILREGFPEIDWKILEMNIVARSDRKIAKGTIIGCVELSRHVDHSFALSFEGDDRYAFADASDYVGTIDFSHRVSKV